VLLSVQMWWVEEYKFGCLHSEKKRSVGRRKRTQFTGRRPTQQRSVAERNEENDTAFHLVTGIKMVYSKWNRKQMALQRPDQ